MSLFLIRLIVITLFTLLFIFVIIKPADPVLAVLLAYVFEYILEPVLVLKIIKNQ